ncbi:MAG: cell division protein SepF [Acidimicrobiaceae bacterium]|nr:cell division protein SepF [Acidimicrobiaceae bacterium]
MSMFRRAMEYLGLGADEAYDDSDQSVRARRPARGRQRLTDDEYDDDDDYTRDTRDDDGDDEADDDEFEAPARSPRGTQPPRGTRKRDDSGVTVRGPVGQPQKNVKSLDHAAVEPVTLKPTSFTHCKEIGERYKSGQPVIMNMISTQPEEARRIIDFASGITFALNGTLERISRGVFRLTPNGVRIPRD